MPVQAPWLLVIVDRASGAPDYALPDATTSIGLVVVVKVLPSGAASTVRAPRSQLIDGSLTFPLAPGEAAAFQARNGNWHVVSTRDLTTIPPHHITHEDGGSDEIFVTGLSGQLAQRQKVRVQDETIDVGTVDTIDFQGAGVTASLSGAKSIVTIPGGGAGSVDIKSTEQDFGTDPTLYKEFAIADGDVVLTSSIIPSLSCEPPVALRDGLAADGDEAEMEPMHVFAKDIGTGTFTLVAEAVDGPLTGPYRFNYLVG